MAWRGESAPRVSSAPSGSPPVPLLLFLPVSFLTLSPLSQRTGRLCSRQGCVPCDHAQSHVVYMQSKCKVVCACLCFHTLSRAFCVRACVRTFVRACVRRTCVRARLVGREYRTGSVRERAMTWSRSWQKLPTFRRKARLLDRDKTRPWGVAEYRVRVANGLEFRVWFEDRRAGSAIPKIVTAFPKMARFEISPRTFLTSEVKQFLGRLTPNRCIKALCPKSAI